MELNRIGAVVRPRNAWESIDLGFSLVQAWWLPLYKVWLSFFIPLALIVYGVAFWVGFSPITGAIIFWWLKPVPDRIVLYFLSHALFGERPTIGQTAKALPYLFWKTRLFHALTLGRLTLIRSFLLPVWQLEGLQGKTRKQRERLLQRRTRDTAVWLTAVCWHFEWILYFSLFGLWYMMMPVVYRVEITDLLLSSHLHLWWIEIIKIVFTIIVVSIVEPLYVAGGFILYLNRRIHLEGWDIELAFRRLGARLSTNATLS